MDLGHLVDARLIGSGTQKETMSSGMPGYCWMENMILEKNLKHSLTRSIPLRPRLKTKPHPKPTPPLSPQDMTLHIDGVGP